MVNFTQLKNQLLHIVEENILLNKRGKKYLEDEDYSDEKVFGHLIADFLSITYNILELVAAFTLIMSLAIIEVVIIIPIRLITASLTYLRFKKSVKKMLKPIILGDCITMLIFAFNCVN